ncbi:hypothetical protein PI124_g16981 [Phytophthora idaei]|nr:hypothetical protein PI125_g17235 [Phytophthora idaei]KAG3238047.1 hypothetical protein PI124_g16981 [Phytophthora idaei]
MVAEGSGAGTEERDAVIRAPTPTQHEPRDSRWRTRVSPYSRTPTRRSPRLTPSPATSIRSQVSARNSRRSTQSTPDAESNRGAARSPTCVIQMTSSTATSASERRTSHSSSTPSTAVSRPATRSPPRLAQTDSAETPSEGPVQVADNHRYQLVVRPIIKTTIAQRGRSVEELDDAAFNGSSFSEILEKIWERFSPRVKGRAIKTDGVWSVEVPTIEKWSKVMQFKARRHLVDSNKSDIAWNRWLHSMLGETVTLLVYEYGLAITKGQDLETFTAACIVPPDTDRAGATAESSLLEVVDRLRERWERTFQGEAIVWRMWANHLTCNLNRSTWEAAIAQPPPEHIACLLRASQSHLERHLETLYHSAELALNCVNAAIADFRLLRSDMERRLDAIESNLSGRKSIVEAFIRNALPPRNVADPLQRMENAEDVDHQERFISTQNPRAASS